jgi:hypothetical protein
MADCGLVVPKIDVGLESPKMTNEICPMTYVKWFFRSSLLPPSLR